MSHATRPGEAQISLLHAQASHLCRKNATTAVSSLWWLSVNNRFSRVSFHRVFFPPIWLIGGKAAFSGGCCSLGLQAATWPVGHLDSCLRTLSGAVCRLVCVVWFFVLKLGQIFLHICNLSEQFNRLNLLFIHGNCLNGF